MVGIPQDGDGKCVAGTKLSRGYQGCSHCGLAMVESLVHKVFECPLIRQMWWHAMSIMWQLLAKGVIGILDSLFFFLYCNGLFDDTLGSSLGLASPS